MLVRSLNDVLAQLDIESKTLRIGVERRRIELASHLPGSCDLCRPILENLT